MVVVRSHGDSPSSVASTDASARVVVEAVIRVEFHLLVDSHDIHVPSVAVLVAAQFRPQQARMDTEPNELESLVSFVDASSRERRFDLPAPALHVRTDCCMRDIQRSHAAVVRESTAKGVGMEASDVDGALAHRAPHTPSESEVEMDLVRLEVAEALRSVVVERDEWLRMDWRRWAAAAAVDERLKACEVCAT